MEKEKKEPMFTKADKFIFFMLCVGVTIFLMLGTASTAKKEMKPPKIVFVDAITKKVDVKVIKAVKDNELVAFKARVTDAVLYFQPEYQIRYTRDYIDAIFDASLKHNVPPEIIVSVIAVESSFRTKVRSSAGAVGPMQVIPSVWKKEKELKDMKFTEFYDNIQAGTYILAKYKKKCGKWECAFKAYNVGITNYRNKKQIEAQKRYYSKIQNVLKGL